MTKRFSLTFMIPELTARVDGEWKPVTRQLGPLTLAVNSGCGNRALHSDSDSDYDAV